MDDREKVIKGLEHCKCRSGCNSNCPYSPIMEDHNFGIDECTSQLAADALSLLKAQEPRVMTITEAFDAEVAWLERYANPDDGVEPIIQPVIIRYYENGYWQCLVEQEESADLSLFLDGFGTEFRFWTSRPTDEQRKAVKWE